MALSAVAAGGLVLTVVEAALGSSLPPGQGQGHGGQVAIPEANKLRFMSKDDYVKMVGPAEAQRQSARAKAIAESYDPKK
jgi:hypothetical protein